MPDPLNDKTLTSVGDQGPTRVPERRQQPRHRLRQAPGTLFWREGDELFTSRMTMVEISGGGAAVLADIGPPVDRPVWVTLESAASGSEELEARVLSTIADRSGKYMVRMRFKSWVPIGAVLEQHEEHRLWERFPARYTSAKLVWYDEDIKYTFAGELLTISGGGAAVITDATLLSEQPLWLTLEEVSDAMSAVECRLVTIAADPSGLRIARLRFVEPCPMDLFELAVHGAESQS